MADGQNPGPDRTRHGATGARKSLNRAASTSLVGRARWTLWWERAWPLLWVPITIVLVFLTVSWLGSGSTRRRLMRSLGLVLFAAALAFLAVADRAACAGRPARAPSTGSTATPACATGRPAPSTTRWRSAAPIPAPAPSGNFTAGAPKPRSTSSGSRPRARTWPRRDRYALRAAGLLAVVGERLRRRAGSRHPPLPPPSTGAARKLAAPGLPGRRLDRSAALYPRRRR